MSRAARTSVILVAIVASALAFVLLRPDEQPATESEAPPIATESPAVASGERPSPTPSRTPSPPLLEAGKVRRLTVRQGETISFRVRHDTDEELHVHGYDIARPVPAGETVTVSFPATIAGIFDIELEHSHTPVASLRVEP